MLTSRNVRGGLLTDFALGGLNYQIEHHLFPNMPRASLRHAQPLVRAHCEALGLPYCETSLDDSYGAALTHLKVEPILVTSLLFALPLSARLANGRLPSNTMVSALVLSVSLSVLVILADGNGGLDRASYHGWLIVRSSLRRSLRAV